MKVGVAYHLIGIMDRGSKDSREPELDRFKVLLFKQSTDIGLKEISMNREGSLDGELLGAVPTQVKVKLIVLGKASKVGVGHNKGPYALVTR